MNPLQYKLPKDTATKLLQETTGNSFELMLIQVALAEGFQKTKEFKKQRKSLLKGLKLYNGIMIRFKLVEAMEHVTYRQKLIIDILQTAILLGKKKYDSLTMIELEYYKKSIEKLALIYCQQNRNEEAFILLQLAGFTHRLSPNVFFYQKTKQVNNTGDVARVYDEFLSDSSIAKMDLCFGPDASFWSTFNYNQYQSNGYFSFVFNLNQKPRNMIEQLIVLQFDLIKQEFPEKSKRIQKAEWWTHCRPHSMGHQMHYDSENEGQGTIRHPQLSSVFYLGSCGGPTLVTNQVLGGNLATKGYLVYPSRNRLCIFDSQYLHGVLPGRQKDRVVSDRRISFMVGFWDEITVFDLDTVGAARPTPAYPEWCPKDHSMKMGALERGPIYGVDRVWETIDGNPIGDILPSYEKCFQGF